MSYVSPLQTESYVYKIANEIFETHGDSFYACVIAPTRGGLVPGVMLSHALKIPLFPVSFSLRDHKAQEDIPDSLIQYVKENGMTAILIDDIVDTGATFEKLHDKLNEAIPGALIDLSALIYNVRSPVGIHYAGEELDRDEYKEFYDFFWEL